MADFTKQELSAIEFQANRIIQEMEYKNKEPHLGDWLTISTLEVWSSILEKVRKM